MSTKAIIRSDVATGRGTNGREMFISRRRELRQLVALAPGAAALGFFLAFDPGGDPGVAGTCWVPVAGLAPVETLIWAPSLNRSVPSTTTVSPTVRPDRMAVLRPSLAPRVTLRTDTVLFALTRYTKTAGAPLSTPGVGTSTACVNVSTRILMLTNSFGNSA